MIQAVFVLASLAVFGHLYVRYLSQTHLEAHRFQFRLADLLIAVAGVALLSASRFRADLLIVLVFVAYTLRTGSWWERTAARWTTVGVNRLAHASGMITGSFSALLPLVATFVALLGPWSELDLKQDPYVPKSLLAVLLPGIAFAWAFIWGDNYVYQGSLILTGLPVNTASFPRRRGSKTMPLPSRFPPTRE